MATGLKRKAAAHNRKLKKLAKTDVTWKARVKKDPGIPSAFPYKDRILAEMEEAKREDLEQKELRRQHRIDTQAAAANGKASASKDTEEVVGSDVKESNANRLGALLESAQMVAGEDDEEDEEMSEEDDEEDEEISVSIEGYSSKEASRKAFEGIYKYVVDASDVVLYVLDARDPEGTRSREVEQAVLANPEKRLLFVLNRTDLIPGKALKKWQAHLGQSFPTIPFAAASPATNAQTFDHTGLTLLTSSITLLNALKAYAKSSQEPITVGVIGYPNVGKSSVINALFARNSVSKQIPCTTGPAAGVTTTIRTIRADKKLKFIDTPGIVLIAADNKKNKKPTDERSRLVLLNALPKKLIGDPIVAVEMLLKRLTSSEELKKHLMTTYNLHSLMSSTSDEMVKDFLVQAARHKGRLNKGGVPDLGSAASAVINDWRDGRILGWTVPKASVVEAAAGKKTKAAQKAAAKWTKEFGLAGLWNGEFGNEEA